MVVYALAGVVAAWELWHRHDSVDLWLDPEGNFTEVIGELYPDDPGVQQLRSVQLGLCLRIQAAGGTLPPACRQYAGKDPVAVARAVYERGIRNGKHIEDLYYDYLRFLILTGADSTEIDAAHAAWRRDFPLSRRPDPLQRRVPPPR
jgi:hypothetical protein